jgi:hypothetical protein
VPYFILTKPDFRHDPARVYFRVAAVLLGFTAVIGLFIMPAVATYVLRTGRLPEVFGVRLLSGGPFEALGPRTMGWLALALAPLGVLEALACALLWRGHTMGARLAALITPVGLVFWVGFALPYGFVSGTPRAVLLALGWRALR